VGGRVSGAVRQPLPGPNTGSLSLGEALSAGGGPGPTGPATHDHEEPHVSPKPRIPGIEARPSGQYRVRINRRGVRCRPEFADLGDAISWRQRALAAIDHDLPLPPLPEEPVPAPRDSAPAASAATVEGAARRLLAGIERGEIRTKTGDLYKPATARKYEAALRLNVIPRLGGVNVTALKRGGVQRMVDTVAAGHGVEQAVNALTALRVVVRACERYGEVEHDPCAGVRVPRSTPTPRAVPLLTPEQGETLVERPSATTKATTCGRPDRSSRRWCGWAWTPAFGSGRCWGSAGGRTGST
jgi:hypothetical protein